MNLCGRCRTGLALVTLACGGCGETPAPLSEEAGIGAGDVSSGNIGAADATPDLSRGGLEGPSLEGSLGGVDAAHDSPDGVLDGDLDSPDEPCQPGVARCVDLHTRTECAADGTSVSASQTDDTRFCTGDGEWVSCREDRDCGPSANPCANLTCSTMTHR
jgi:hypothetical protein